MAETELNREEDLRRLLTDAIEVQLAALRAGISFWSEWVEQTSKFVQSATESLSTIKAEKQQAKDVLLELVDAGRASVRSMTDIPRHTATRFLEELDRLEQDRDTPVPVSASRPAPAPATSTRPAAPVKKKASRRPPAKRAGRVKP